MDDEFGAGFLIEPVEDSEGRTDPPNGDGAAVPAADGGDAGDNTGAAGTAADGARAGRDPLMIRRTNAAIVPMRRVESVAMDPSPTVGGVGPEWRF